ncbi:MAG TPA: LytTR family DNA-binding domain-containing protein [Cyclobacteriaceae bacterium]|nr:LytTR family DNA-binding domain-containing protein [Cyclobacteriaceae bacterium]
MIKCIAIDDEPLALEIIKNFSKKITFLELLECFTDAFQAADYLQKNRVDLMFLDIRMPSISGLDFIKTLSNPPMVILTTAHSEHAIQGFDLNVLDYLLKPFSLARFLQACTKANELFELRTQAEINKDSFFIKSGYEKIKVNINEILYVEGEGNYMVFVLKNKRILSRYTMSDVESLLPRSLFVRLHRSYIISLKHIDRADKRSVWIGETELPIGKSYQEQFEKLLH